MNKVILLLIFCLSLNAQDEWFFRDMLSGQVDIPASPPRAEHFISSSKIYELDVSGDGVNEVFKFQFIDGLTKMKFFNYKKELISSFQFEIKGYGARPYRILKKYISKNLIVVTIFFFDGQTGYLEKQGSSSIYVGVVENGDISNFKIQKMTSVWHEHRDGDSYVRRPYHVDFEDINGDEIQEIIVESGKVKRIFTYLGYNKWQGN